MIQSFMVKIKSHLTVNSTVNPTDSPIIIKMKKKTMLAKALDRHSGDALNMVKFSSIVDPHFIRKIYNVNDELEKYF